METTAVPTKVTMLMTTAFREVILSIILPIKIEENAEPIPKNIKVS